MPQYRLFIMERVGHIVRAQVIEVIDDDGAPEQAKQYVDGHDVEVWELKRKIAHLKHDIAHLKHDDPLK